MSSEIDKASALADAGLRLIPLRPETKRPAIKNWQDRSTNDPATLREWFVQRKWIVGLPTGAINGLAVVDVDVKSGDGFAAARGAGLHLDSGHRVNTPSGGAHFFFAHAPGVRNDPPRTADGATVPHVDVRGDGGLVRVYDAEDLATTIAHIGLAPWPLPVRQRSPHRPVAASPDLSWPLFEKALRCAPEARWDDRTFWLESGMACHWYGDRGRDLWDELSAQSGKFDDAEQDKAWRGFRCS